MCARAHIEDSNPNISATAATGVMDATPWSLKTSGSHELSQQQCNETEQS